MKFNVKLWASVLNGSILPTHDVLVELMREARDAYSEAGRLETETCKLSHRIRKLEEENRFLIRQISNTEDDEAFHPEHW